MEIVETVETRQGQLFIVVKDVIQADSQGQVYTLQFQDSGLGTYKILGLRRGHGKREARREKEVR